MSAEIDRELASLGRCEAQLRFRIGELVDRLHLEHGHHELGFSSIDAYVVERCRRSRRWGRETRGLARRIRELGLPAIRRAIRAGSLGWSMADILVRRARTDNEEALLAQASGSTVREMQAGLTGAELPARDEPIETTSVHGVSPEELLLVNASRLLVGYLSGGRASDEMLVTALLGEAETTLQSLAGARVEEIVLPAIDAATIEAGLEALRAARSRKEPKEMVDATPVHVEPMEDRPLPKSVREIDHEIVRCCRELARRNLRIGRLARRLLESRSWRTLGYRSSGQYARERVGVSLSSLEHRATLARRIERWPALGEALEQGEVGYEAALLIGRVVGASSSAELVRAWIERAKVRTYKHLREEVDAVLLGAGLDPRVDRGPPTDEDLEAAAQFERRVQSGDLFRSLLGVRTPGPQTSVTLIAGGSPVRPLRLTLPVELQLHWQRIEAEFYAVAGWRASFVAFASFSLWSTWLPYLEAWDDKWIDIYRRDRHRCSSPVCERCDVTPHHIVYGGDERTNVLAACSWCHLYGIHRGRLSVRGPALSAEWTVGSEAWTGPQRTNSSPRAQATGAVSRHTRSSRWELAPKTSSRPAEAWSSAIDGSSRRFMKRGGLEADRLGTAHDERRGCDSARQEHSPDHPVLLAFM